MNADKLIAALNLQPHPREGGHYRETYRADERLVAAILPDRYTGDRSVCTAIYYLLTASTFSALHRLASDEIFHFYLGDPVQMLQLSPDGAGRVITLGPDILAGQQPQVLALRGVWQGSMLVPGGNFALLGCTVAPGFDYADYEHGERAALIKQYPQFADMITRLAPSPLSPLPLGERGKG